MKDIFAGCEIISSYGFEKTVNSITVQTCQFSDLSCLQIE